MRVNSPGPELGPAPGAELGMDAAGGKAGDGAAAGAGGAACGNGTGSAENSEDGGGAAGGATGGAAKTGAGEGGADAGSGFLPSAASRSSSSRDEELGTVPKIPVALEIGPGVAPGGDPPPGESDWGACGLPKRSQNAFMRVHHLRQNIALFRNPRLHRFGLTVKGRQPTMQAHSRSARSGLIGRAALKPFACPAGSTPLNRSVHQTIWLL